MATVQGRINRSPTNLDVVTPIKARACDALQAMLGTRSRRVRGELRVMRRGAERC